MDEDEYMRLISDQHYQCPYYRNGDEYMVVRKQMWLGFNLEGMTTRTWYIVIDSSNGHLQMYRVFFINLLIYGWLRCYTFVWCKICDVDL